MADWQMFARDAAYRLNGGLRLSAVQGVRRHLGVDTAVVETPYSPEAYARTGKGCGVVINRNGLQEFSGLVGSERTMGWDSETGEATIKVQCVGDNVHFADRLAFPDPTRPGDDQTTNDYWTYNGRASSAMWALINQQAGPAALPERRVPQLIMGADPGVGSIRDPWYALFTDVMLTCSSFSALSGANPGIRLTSTPDGLLCDIVAARNVSDSIRFSADLSNLSGFAYTETSPSVIYALVAGQGDLHLRLRRAATSTVPGDLAWGRRIERYVDRRDEADADNLAQAAADEVTEGAGTVNLTCTLSDSQAARYRDDWDLGDQVTVYVGLPGQVKPATVVDVVREVAFTVGNDGAEKLTPAIGTFDAKAVLPTPTQARLSAIGKALTNLSRK